MFWGSFVIIYQDLNLTNKTLINLLWVNFLREKYNVDKFLNLNKSTITIASATVVRNTAYCVDEEKEQSRDKNNNIVEAITHKPIKYDEWPWLWI